MELRFCPLFSGSSGNASVVEAGETRILVDAGVTGRALEQALAAVGVDPRSLAAVVISHEHSDHVRGLGVLARRYRIPVYANAACWEAMPRQVGEIEPRFVRVFETGRDFYLRDVNVTPFPVYHDSADPVGFRFSWRGRAVCTVTDTGYADERLLSRVYGAQVVLLEANHDIDMLHAGPYPEQLKRRILSRHGHLSNEAAGEAAVALGRNGAQVLLLGHLSARNNTPDMAFAAVRRALDQAGLSAVELALTSREGPTGMACADAAASYAPLRKESV